MPRLILLNGPPGSGKSTLPQRYVDDRPLALNLDIDWLRGLLGQWRADAHSAGLLARAIALAAARVHLAAGHDVVVPQFLGRPEFIRQLEQLALEMHTEFHEVVLMDDKENALRRFTDRTRAALDPTHVEAQETLDRAGVLDELDAMYDRLVAMLTTRPRAKIVAVEDGNEDQAYRDFIRVICTSSPTSPRRSE